MSAKLKMPKFNFLRDEPLDKNSESYFNFYHSSIAPALTKILKSKTAPHTIGIFGSWGTGKSTIINMLKDDKQLKSPIFVFDAWKYQEDSLRRTFLIKLVDFLGNEVGITFEDNFLSDMYHASEEHTPVAKSKEGFWKKTWHIITKNLLLTILVLLLIATVIVVLLVPQHPYLAVVSDALKFLSSISLIATIAQPLLSKVLERVGDILLQNSKTTQGSIMRITTKERLNSPEEFENKFKDILKRLEKRKLVIVFDNIDRVQGDVAISMISTIKTFMEPNNESRVIFIIPCDPDAIDEQIVNYYTNKKGGVTGYQSAEYLRKVFNLIIWLPDYINTDLEEYTSKCLASTGEISTLLNTGDVVLVINSAFSRNPREIIQFVNNLTALTIAAHNSSVAEHIVQNIAYLAKTQVIKQKFPAGYKRLQASWNNPEAIYENEPKELEEIALKEFMLATSRITVDDAEPYIYFKDPLASRGLKEPQLLLQGLLQGNAEVIQDRINAESNPDAVAKFTLDLANKYKAMPRSIVALYNAQFKTVYEVVPDAFKRRYLDSLARLVDINLWSRFTEIDTDMTFKLMQEPSLDKELKAALKLRYLNSLKYLDGDQNPSGEVLKKIVVNIRDYKKSFTTEQLVGVNKNIEENPSLGINVLDLFESLDLQEQFVSENLFLESLKSISPDNVLERMELVEKYKDYVKQHSILPDTLSAFTTTLESAYNTGSSASVVPYAKSIGKLIKLDREAIKATAYQSYTASIFNNFIAALNTSGADDLMKANILTGLWWLYGVAPTYDDSIVNTVTTQIGTINAGAIKTFIDVWNDATKINIVNTIKPTLMQRVVDESEIRDYIYALPDTAIKSSVVTEIIKNNPRPDSETQAFLSANAITSIEAMTLAIEDVYRTNGFLDAAYTDFIAKKLRGNSSRDAKLPIINLTKSLTKQEDPTNNAAGTTILQNEKFMSQDDKREFAEDYLSYLEARTGQIDASHVSGLGFIVKWLPSNSFRSRIVTVLLGSLASAQTETNVKDLLAIVSGLKVRFNAYSSEIKSLYEQVVAQPETDVRNAVTEGLYVLHSPRQSKAEKDFWTQVANKQLP